MHRMKLCAAWALGLAVALWAAPTAMAQDKKDKKKEEKKEVKKTKEVWTDAKDASIPPEFHFQGEYVGATSKGKVGMQVIALGKGKFQAVIYSGGLPGAGWDGVNRSLMQGELDAEKAVFAPASGKRKYLAGPPDEFSATSMFPPKGHQEYRGTIYKGVFQGAGPDGEFKLSHTVRQSPTLGAKAPPGAVILYDGSNASEWSRGRIDKDTGLLNTDGSDIVSKRKFSNYHVHVEFLLPYRPDARGQGRGNSGFYMVDHYEVQILDSFGLEGKDNECGGIYSRKASLVNMCLPPLVWQTYDIEFTNAVADGGKVVKKSRITAKLNGVVIHDDYELPGVTGGARMEPEGTPGPLRLQGHGNPLQFRNIWIVERK